MKKILAFAALIGIAAAGTTWNIRRHDSPLGLTPQEKCALRDAPHDDLSADFSDLRQNMKNGARKLTHDLAAEKTARATLSIQGPILNGIFDADVPAGIQGQMRADMAFIDDIQANAARLSIRRSSGPQMAALIWISSRPE